VPNDFAQELASAIRANEPLPKFNEALDLEAAYALQHRVTKSMTSGPTGGIKAGVTAGPVQAFFGLEHALIASIYPEARQKSGDTIGYVEGRGIECEVAVLLDGNGRPKAIAPAIEFVFVKFSDQSDMIAANLVASNLGADVYLVGDFQPWADGTFSALSAILTRDGEEVSRANMNDAIGGPGPATEWIVQEANTRSFDCREDTLIMTGACGALVPGEKGDYRMSIEGLGAVEFTIA